MTKAQQIMDLYDGKRTTREIADIVGCHAGYVRAVRQRAADPVLENQRTRDWYHANRLKRLASQRAYMARKREAPNAQA